ncbi:unnamed protein product [Chrysoparadoxa australica]
MLRGKSCLVVGGAGQVGRRVVGAIREIGVDVLAVDVSDVEESNQHLTLRPSDSIRYSAGRVRDFYNGKPLDAVICCGGGWLGGSIAKEDTLDSVDAMFKANAHSAVLASHLAAHLLSKNGLLVVMGAEAALAPCPEMIGYGMAKAATHHLMSSIVQDPAMKGHTCITIVPQVIDTDANRAAMASADFDAWTKTQEIADKMVEWIAADINKRPKSGSMLAIRTTKGKTSWDEV